MSLSEELTGALDELARVRKESRSSIAEMLLREAPQVRNALRESRGGDDPPQDHAGMEAVGSRVRRVYG